MRNKLKVITFITLVSVIGVGIYFYFFGRSSNIVIGIPEKDTIVGDVARYINSQSCDEYSQIVIQKYMINKEKIHSCESTLVANQNYYLVEIEYGEAQDCPAGCFYETQVYKVSVDKKSIEVFEDGINFDDPLNFEE